MVIYDLKTGNAIREHSINLNKNEDRRWLLRVQLWALRNRNSVEVISKEDNDIECDATAGPER